MRTDIQGLRGIAVLLVVFYHADLGLKAGYLGVDIFFVISGYLITGLICRSLDENRFSFADFYWRRAKRLLPAAFVTFLATSIVASALLTQLELRSYVSQLIGALTFTANFVLAQQAGYFDTAATLKPLLHTWSLAVEEQYYLLAPFILWITPPRLRRPIVVAVIVASLLLCVLFARSKPSFAFYLLPARAWELALGAFLALSAVPKLSTVTRALAGTIAVLVLVAVPALSIDPVHPRTDAVIVCLATAIVIATQPALLSHGPLANGLARVGDISYSLYLVHWPVFAFAHTIYFSEPPLLLRLALLVAVFPLAMALCRWVENPIRHTAIRPSLPVLAGSCTLIAAALAIPLSYLALASQQRDWTEIRRPNTGFDPACDQRALTKIPACQNKPNPTIAVWGDSFAMHLVPGLAAEDRGRGIIQLTRSSCPPTIEPQPQDAADRNEQSYSCEAFNRAVLERIIADGNLQYVVLASASNFDRIGPTVQSLQAAGKRVVYVAPPPFTTTDYSICVERLLDKRVTLDAPEDCSFSEGEYLRIQRSTLDQLRSVSTQHAFGVISLSEAFCSDGRCMTNDGSTSFYRDSAHLSVDGSIYAARKLDLISAILRSAR